MCLQKSFFYFGSTNIIASLSCIDDLKVSRFELWLKNNGIMGSSRTVGGSLWSWHVNDYCPIILAPSYY